MGIVFTRPGHRHVSDSWGWWPSSHTVYIGSPGYSSGWHSSHHHHHSPSFIGSPSSVSMADSFPDLSGRSSSPSSVLPNLTSGSSSSLSNSMPSMPNMGSMPSAPSMPNMGSMNMGSSGNSGAMGGRRRTRTRKARGGARKTKTRRGRRNN